MGYSADTEYRNNTPGPAHYNSRIRTEQSFNRSQKYFTVAKRVDSTHGKPSVAVGMYNIATETPSNHKKIK